MCDIHHTIYVNADKQTFQLAIIHFEGRPTRADMKGAAAIQIFSHEGHKFTVIYQRDRVSNVYMIELLKDFLNERKRWRGYDMNEV